MVPIVSTRRGEGAKPAGLKHAPAVPNISERTCAGWETNGGIMPSSAMNPKGPKTLRTVEYSAVNAPASGSVSVASRVVSDRE